MATKSIVIKNNLLEHIPRYWAAGGSVELGAVGVSISIINLVSKMFNLPLLNITTSFVSEDASVIEDLLPKPSSPVQKRLLSLGALNEVEENCETLELCGPAKPCLPSIASALIFGTALGLGEDVILSFFARPILTVMDVNASSPMRLPAAQFLMYKAIGAPALVVALAIQGVFQGFKDTKSPLYATVAGNVVNIILDPILIFILKLNEKMVAISTTISKYLAFILPIAQIGFLFGIFIAVLLGATMLAFSRVFTIDVNVLNVIKGLNPVVALTQPINPLAFAFDGLHYGASDFAYAAHSMILVAVPSVAVLVVLPRFGSLKDLWA